MKKSVMVLIVIILSWVIQTHQSPIAYVLFKITKPILSLARKVIPSIYGIDFSPILAIIILKLFSILLTTPVIQFGMRLAIR